ncbi:4-fold beta flower protein [Dactylosporangium sp. CA-052675]|uniref:4-fold beta flower protein n=1 Tax=Dactylosporangium sp. CA-052675 TaxID=3239927 RepID=UPI003D8CF02E
MQQLRDEHNELVGWIQPDAHIFDVDMNWVAYISNGHAWSALTGNWCGPVDGLTCLDQSGRVVAWNPNQALRGSARPARPARAARAARPARPARPRPACPARPARPAGGYSALPFQTWTHQ